VNFDKLPASMNSLQLCERDFCVGYVEENHYGDKFLFLFFSVEKMAAEPK
jgi:hypothetical protein